VIVLLFIAAAPLQTFTWSWAERPDAASVSRCLPEIERIAEARPDAVSATIYDGIGRLPAIVIKDEHTQTPNDFMFPGTAPGVNTLDADNRLTQAIVGAALLVASDCFGRHILAVSGGDWATDWAAARALYTEVIHRQIASPLGAPEPAERASTSPISDQILAMVPMLLTLLFLFGRGRGGSGVSWGSYYLIYLLAPMAIAWVTSFPWLLALAPIAIVGRKWLPDPYLFFRRRRRMNALRTAVKNNPHDTQSAIDLAALYLEQRRPQRALPLVDRALERDPRVAELIHYRGLSLLGLGRYAEAYLTFAAAAELQPKLRYGEPLLRAGDSLVAQKKHKDALPLYERFVQLNHSSIEGLYKLSRARETSGDRQGSRDARSKARSLYGELPAYARKSQLGWYLRSWVV
jgi:tetratricopeptide (TPR) repeat protein